jgi:hypothetical protein
MDWFKGLKEDEKKELILSITNSPAIKVLLKIVSGWENELKTKRSDYDNPSWSHRQAHDNGLAEAYSKIKRLLDQKET